MSYKSMLSSCGLQNFFKKNLKLLCLLFLLINFGAVKAQIKLDELILKASKVNVNAYTATEVLRLLDDFDKLQNEKESTNELLKKLIAEKYDSELKYKLLYIRDQIELQKYGFYVDGKVLPEFNDLVSVKVDNQGKIVAVNIVITGSGSASDGFINNLFAGDAELLKYPITAMGLKSGLISYSNEPVQILGSYIKRINTVSHVVKVKGGSVIEKNNYAEKLLKQINEYYLFNKISGNIQEYLTQEKKKVPSNATDDIIDYRISIIAAIKQILNEK